MNLLYLTDVFCPWCYGFAPVMRRLAAEHPELPVRVLGGNLMDEPQTLTGMLEEYPTIREFFARLQETTGQSTEHFRQALEQAVAGTGPDLLMHSPAMNLPLAALRHLAPGHELEQMEAFQMAFYAQGRDVMAAGEQAAIAAAWLPAGTPADALTKSTFGRAEGSASEFFSAVEDSAGTNCSAAVFSDSVGRTAFVSVSGSRSAVSAGRTEGLTSAARFGRRISAASRMSAVSGAGRQSAAVKAAP